MNLTTTTTTAAAQAGVTVATIRTWCRMGAVTATKRSGRWVIDSTSLARRITIGIRRTRQEAPMDEQYPWDKDHDEAANFIRLVEGGISPEQIVKALGDDATGMGRFRRLNGKSRRWIDARLGEIDARAEEQQRSAATQAREGLATARQIGYILDLLAARRRSGEGGGYYSGPTDRAGIARMTRAEASSYIDSLKGAY